METCLAVMVIGRHYLLVMAFLLIPDTWGKIVTFQFSTSRSKCAIMNHFLLFLMPSIGRRKLKVLRMS